MDVRTDIVGGVNAIARAWIEADDAYREAMNEMGEVKGRADAALQRKEDAAKRLCERVGRNISEKAFNVDGEIVLVEHERGIRRISIEDREK